MLLLYAHSASKLIYIHTVCGLCLEHTPLIQIHGHMVMYAHLVYFMAIILAKWHLQEYVLCMSLVAIDHHETY